MTKFSFVDILFDKDLLKISQVSKFLFIDLLKNL